MTELRFAFSRFLENPGVTVVAMLTLALEFASTKATAADARPHLGFRVVLRQRERE